MTKSEKGAISTSGSKRETNMWDPKVFMSIREAGMKLCLKVPLVPMKAASHAMFGKVGW